MKHFSRKRHVAKTLTWRIVGTLDTILLAWLISGDIKIGAAIGGAEVITKLLLYYLHERVWYRTNVFKSSSSRVRHVLKTITWRLVGTMDTMFMGWLISGNPIVGLKIGGLELVTKMGLYYLHERIWHRSDFGLLEIATEMDQETGDLELNTSNVFNQNFSVHRSDRNLKNRHNSLMILFTGLSGSGKSTIANKLELKLHDMELQTYSLDGDNLRLGLNKDLGFSPEDRKENLRRIAEVSKLMVDAGIITVAAFVSPMKEDRELIKNIVGAKNFIEIYVNTSLEECEKRDVKGLYAKARNGEISNFTGISAPYEAPENPTIEIKTEKTSVDEAVEKIIKIIHEKLEMPNE
ncbi:MAG: adenylyl-sulfate kinase [Bacteroidota bacterium]|jgi:adenylylsulfate kinase